MQTGLFTEDKSSKFQEAETVLTKSHLLTVKSLSATSELTSQATDMDLVFKSGLTAQSTKETGSTTELMEMESFGTLTEIFTRVSSKMTNQMDMGFIIALMALNTQESGLMTFKMDRDQLHGQTGRATLVIIMTVKSKVMAPTSGLKETHTLASGLII